MNDGISNITIIYLQHYDFHQAQWVVEATFVAQGNANLNLPPVNITCVHQSRLDPATNFAYAPVLLLHSFQPRRPLDIVTWSGYP